MGKIIFFICRSNEIKKYWKFRTIAVSQYTPVSFIFIIYIIFFQFNSPTKYIAPTPFFVRLYFHLITKLYKIFLLICFFFFVDFLYYISILGNVKLKEEKKNMTTCSYIESSRKLGNLWALYKMECMCIYES